MSITRRILESAQSGLSKLTSLVIVDDEPLSHVESAALKADLVARKAARERVVVMGKCCERAGAMSSPPSPGTGR